MEKNNTKKSLAGIIGLIGASLIVLLLIVYIGFGLFFNSHFFFGTRMESIECSLRTVEEAQEEISKESGSYTLEIIGRDGVSETIGVEEIGLVLIFDSSLADMIEGQNGFLWPRFLFQNETIEVPVAIEYSEDALKTLFDQFQFFDRSVVRAPKNAYIGEFDKESKQYPIIAEDKGTVLNKKLTYQMIKEAIDNLDHQIDLDELGCYIQPEITADSPELLREQQMLNKLTGVVITYQFDEEQEIVDGQLIVDWIIKDEQGNYSIDADPVREYINGLARKYDTFGQTRKFHTSRGEIITMSGGSYGWWMNRPGETQELIERIIAGESGPKEINYYGRAVRYGPNDIGDSYVEIDLTNQYLYLYINGEIILESDFVSGCVIRGFNTPTGVYGLTYKERDATLNGENYSTPVTYWMPFNGNVGMHDAGWRREFGGEVFVTNGSHGCINLPPEKAKEIYGYVDKGFPVIVYGGYAGIISPPEEPPAQPTEVQVPEALLPQIFIPEETE